MAPNRIASRIALAGAAAVALFALTACTPVTNGATNTFPGWPEVSMPGEGGSGTLSDGTPHAMWVDEGRKIAIITSGSSTCPIVGTTLDVVEPAGQGNTVKMNVKEYAPTQPCTMDLVPYTTEFWTPQRISTAEPLHVVIGDTTVKVPVKGASE